MGSVHFPINQIGKGEGGEYLARGGRFGRACDMHHRSRNGTVLGTRAAKLVFSGWCLQGKEAVALARQ